MQNCMHALAGTSVRALLVASVGFSFLGHEQSHPGSFARAMLRLYAQDPVAHVKYRCVLFFLSLRGSLSSQHLFRGAFELLITDCVATNSL